MYRITYKGRYPRKNRIEVKERFGSLTQAKDYCFEFHNIRKHMQIHHPDGTVERFVTHKELENG